MIKKRSLSSNARRDDRGIGWIFSVILASPNETDKNAPCFMDHHVSPFLGVLLVVAEQSGTGKTVVRVKSTDPRNTPGAIFRVTRDMLPGQGDCWLKAYLETPDGRGHFFFNFEIAPGSHWIEHTSPKHEATCPKQPDGEISLSCITGLVGCGFTDGTLHPIIDVHLADT